MQSFDIKKGVRVHYIETDKYKTNTLSFYFYRSLKKEEASLNALLMQVLRRGGKGYETTADLERYLEEQYGAVMDTGVRKKGDVQVLYVSFDFVNERYIKGKITRNVFNIARDVIFRQEMFAEEYVEQEKTNLKNQIQALINNKGEYAQIRCVEEMCGGEAYGICEYGDAAEIDKIDRDMLWEYYMNFRAKLDVFMTGTMDIEWAKGEIFDMTRAADEDYPISCISPCAGERRNVTQREQVNQAKLSIGFKTNTAASKEEYFAMMVYNSIYGGSVFSKLFNNVREKLSLAYHVSSRIDKFKGVMLVNAGIEMENYKVALDEILAQAKAVRDGDFTDSELDSAKLASINGIKSISDNARQTEDYWVGQLLVGRDEGLEELAAEIDKITREQVVEAAQRVEIDTVYFLTGVPE